MGKWFEMVSAVGMSVVGVVHVVVGTWLIWTSDAKTTTLVGLSVLASASIYAFCVGFALAMHIANDNIRRMFTCRE